MKAAIDTLWREGEAGLQSAYSMLSEAGWDGRGPAKSLLGVHGGIGASPGYKGYWLAAFAMACNAVWRYAKFADNVAIVKKVEPLCHETAQRILDIRVPTSGIYNEIDDDGNIVERMHPDIAGWVFDAYDWDARGQRYISRAWIPTAASVVEWLSEAVGISAPFQPDWRNGANVSYESALMYWKALDMYIANFGDFGVNHPPVAVATATPSTTTAGTRVTLDGTGSSDPDGDRLSYAWTQTSGPTVTLSSSTVAKPTFTAPSSGTLTFKLTVSDGRFSDTDTVTIRVNRPPTETWGPWRDTGDTRGCGPSKEKQQARTSSRGNRDTKWVYDAEPERWGSWTRTGRTRGSLQNRRAQESRTSHCGNTETKWVSDPEPETWGSWSDTGRTRGSGQSYQVEQSRTSNYGNTQTRWVFDLDPGT